MQNRRMRLVWVDTTAHFTATTQLNPRYCQDEGPLGFILPAYCFIPVHTLWHCQPTQSAYHCNSFHYQGLCKQNSHMTGKEYSMLHGKG